LKGNGQALEQKYCHSAVLGDKCDPSANLLNQFNSHVPVPCPSSFSFNLLLLFIIIIFYPGVQFPGNEKNYAMQHKKVQKIKLE